MVSSVRLAIVSLLLIFSAAVSSLSQTTSEKAANGSISGKVTIKGKGAAGVIVFAEEQNSGRWNRPRFRATTDPNGTYRITNVPAGSYSIRPLAPSYTPDDLTTSNSVVVREGEIIEDLNFSLVRGGVITGKISDADGRPLIEQNVNIFPIDSAFVSVSSQSHIHTDDRGIYRAFGLPQGKYKVSVGQNESLPEGSRPSYRQTYYPSVTDFAKATVIEVTEGSEATNIDIVTGRPVSTFKVSGRVVDAETGKPLSKIKYGVYRSHGEYGGSSIIGQTFTDADGEFRLENVLPGKYAVFVVPEDSGVRGDSVTFEVVDRDVVDLVIRAGKSASVSGVVVFEDAGEAKSGLKTTDLFINAWVEGTALHYSGGYTQPVKPDGSFRIGDLRKGLTHFSFTSPLRRDIVQLQLVRVERDGVVQPRGLILKDGEQVTGVRLVVKYLTGAIHGQIKVEGDESLPNSRLSVWISYLNNSEPNDPYVAGNSVPQLDSRKRFAVEGLAAGTYEVNVAVFDPNRQDTQKIFKEQVTVSDNAISEVTITVKSKPQP